MVKLIFHWFAAALAIMIVSLIIPGTFVAGFGAALIAALVIGLLNILLRPILLVLTLPINIVTLGLFTFVINALIILLTSKLIPSFYVHGFWTAVLFGIVLAIVNVLFSTAEASIEQ